MQTDPQIIFPYNLLNTKKKAFCILRRFGGSILGNSHVVSYQDVTNSETSQSQAQITLEDGTIHTGDILV